VPKHAVQRSRRLGHLKVLASVVLVVVFVSLFVGSATGMIGRSDGGDDDRAAGVDSRASDAASDAASDDASTAADASVSAEPTEIVTDVPPQDVKGAKKLKRSLAWLRRGLADETTFRVGTFNVLGSSHTAKGGNHKGFGSGYTRMGMAWSLVAQAELSVVGFQELEEVQYSRMMSLSGWEAYPGPTLDRGSIRDSIAWDPDVWELVEANSVGVPYFGGQIIRRPVVKLKNIDSGREVWFFNTHNPATTKGHGNNARWRGAAVGIEVQLANDLGSDGTPVVFTGDYNDRAEVFCPIVGGTELEAANGGSYVSGCATPDHMDVDWIFGSGMEWSGFVSASQGIVGRVSDHPFVYAEAYVPEEPLGGDTPSDAPTPSDGSSPSSDSSESSDSQ
jgi:Endonuclease/Exonuclease/phosphatase family